MIIFTIFLAGRDHTFSYGSVYPKKTANEMWDHAVDLAGTDECVFLQGLYKIISTGMTASRNRRILLKLAQVLCVKASRT
jgi:hypothetical protein